VIAAGNEEGTRMRMRQARDSADPRGKRKGKQASPRELRPELCSPVCARGKALSAPQCPRPKSSLFASHVSAPVQTRVELPSQLQSNVYVYFTRCTCTVQ